MKKTILATTLALGLGVTGIAAEQNAEASVQDINKEELAHQAQNNPGALNAAALHEGAYDYDFELNNIDYSFESDGANYSWTYNGGSNVQAPAVEEETQNVQDNTQEVQTQPQTQTQTAAPAVQEYTETQQTETVQPAAPAPAPSEPAQETSSNGSTKSQFLAAGGTEGMWNSIVLPESSGNPNAVSPNGYQGLGQTKESWGTGSVAEQTSGMLNYAEERYGSIDAALSFREANNWW